MRFRLSRFLLPCFTLPIRKPPPPPPSPSRCLPASCFRAGTGSVKVIDLQIL
ncbi:hypothetical protein Godav_011617, partial [Gossypium davidsonii]|nr:hypothetical protein [Gossypium davidsonii]